MQKSDAQIIEEYQGGKRDEFEEIVRRYLKPIYNFILRFSGSGEEAEDLTQEVFLRAWKNLDKFDSGRNFKAWIFAIARNTAIDWLRKKKSINFSRLDTSEEKFEDTLIDPEPLPEDMFSRAELGLELERALDGISPVYKEIILFHHLEELTFEEIAEIVGKPMNTVKSQYRRALISLRSRLS